jgi:diguanylate cyclase (GGDEF)-like protein
VRRFRLLVLVCLLAPPLSFAGNGSASFERTLETADEMRSADPVAFHRLLDQLDSEVGQADAVQRQRLQYLHAYAMVTSPDKLNEGIALAKTLFKQASDVNLKFRAGALVANSGAINRDFGQGLRYLELAMALRNRVTDKEIRDDGTNVAAVLYNQLGQYALGRRYAEETLADSPQARQRCFASHLRLEAMWNLGQLSKDDNQIRKVVDQCVADDELIVGNFVRATLARKWESDGRPRAAIDLLKQHLDEVHATRFPRLIMEIESLLAHLLLRTGDIAGAERYADAAIARSAGLATSLPAVMAFETRYEVAASRHDLPKALASYKLYAAADRAYLSDVKARELAYHLVRQETLQKNQQIELLNRQNTLLQLQQRVDKQKAENSRLLMLMFAAFALIIAYWGYKMRRLHVSLRRMAETDALTGICNRHYFTAQSEKTLVHCAKVGEQVSLIMFDLDHFKVINDTYGHVTGDWVLKEVAKTCAELCRRMDYFGRLGGEEFAILLQGCDARAATRIADDCRMRISRIQSAPSGHAFTISASFGVSCTASSGYDLDKLISHSDQMLYRAKREGRNRVKTYTHDVPMEMREPAPWHETMQQSVDAAGQVDPDVPALGAMNA